MEHFRLEDWVNFVRGAGPERSRQPLEDHLGQGCPRCSDLVARLRSVSATVQQDARFPVPPEVLLRAYTIFPAPVREEEGSSYPRRVAGLLFDSWAGPVAAGVRSARDGTRQLSYNAGDLTVDVSIEAMRKSMSVMLTGQIHSDAEKRSGMPVKLMAGHRVLADGITNEFGEFVLKGKPQDNAHLSIVDPRRGLQVLIPLPEMKAYALPARVRDTK